MSPSGVEHRNCQHALSRSTADQDEKPLGALRCEQPTFQMVALAYLTFKTKTTYKEVSDVFFTDR
jgi:hypothetical protein